MNKKIPIILMIAVILVASLFLFFNKEKDIENNLPSTPINSNDKNVNEKSVEVTDSEKIEKIKNDSYLNILLQIKTFDSLNVSYEPLLEAAMRIAGELNLYETPDNGTYVEYVPRSTVHKLIYELSGIRINDPIIIEDFYYLYNQEGDYYYIVPIGSDWLELKEISSIQYTSNSDQYIITCSAENLSDYAIKTIYPNVELRLKYKPSNSYIKYQLVSLNVGKSTVEVLAPDDYSLEDDNDYDFSGGNAFSNQEQP